MNTSCALHGEATIRSKALEMQQQQQQQSSGMVRHSGTKQGLNWHQNVSVLEVETTPTLVVPRILQGKVHNGITRNILWGNRDGAGCRDGAGRTACDEGRYFDLRQVHVGRQQPSINTYGIPQKLIYPNHSSPDLSTLNSLRRPLPCHFFASRHFFC